MTETGLNIGMLWFDNDSKRTLEEKVVRAAIYYEKKYGFIPDVCAVHPSSPSANELEGVMWKYDSNSQYYITIVKSRSVLVNHLWIGSTKVKYEYNSDFKPFMPKTDIISTENG